MPAQAGLTIPESVTSCMPSQRPPITGRAKELASAPMAIPIQTAKSCGRSNATTPIAATFTFKGTVVVRLKYESLQQTQVTSIIFVCIYRQSMT
jgi:hypothetical protein